MPMDLPLLSFAFCFFWFRQRLLPQRGKLQLRWVLGVQAFRGKERGTYAHCQECLAGGNAGTVDSEDENKSITQGRWELLSEKEAYRRYFSVYDRRYRLPNGQEASF